MKIDTILDIFDYYSCKYIRRTDECSIQCSNDNINWVTVITGTMLLNNAKNTGTVKEITFCDKYEYDLFKIVENSEESNGNWLIELNKKGDEGWEVIHVFDSIYIGRNTISTEHTKNFFLKRRIN